MQYFMMKAKKAEQLIKNGTNNQSRGGRQPELERAGNQSNKRKTSKDGGC